MATTDEIVGSVDFAVLESANIDCAIGEGTVGCVRLYGEITCGVMNARWSLWSGYNST